MSQRNAYVPGGDSVVLVDATSANEIVYLPRGFAVGRRFTVKRVDNSAFTVTVVPPPGETLDGVVDATATVAGNNERSFLLRDPLLWESFGVGDLSVFQRRENARLVRVQEALKAIPSRGIGFSDVATANLSTETPTISRAMAASLTSGITVASAGQWAGENQYSVLNVSSANWPSTGNQFLYDSTNTVQLRGECSVQAVTVTGTTVEFGNFIASGGSAHVEWIWIDGKPLTAAPTDVNAAISLTTNGTYYLKLVFATPGVHTVTHYMSPASPVSIRTTHATSALAPLPSRGAAKVFELGDSYTGASSNCPPLVNWAHRLNHAADLDGFIAGIGGSGYVSPASVTGPNLNDPTRLDPILLADPDLLLILAGLNDKNSALYPVATVGANATAVYKYLYDRNPKIPIIVAGPTCVNYDNTFVTNPVGPVNQALRTAATAAPNVIGYIDMVGNSLTGAVPAALVTSTAYVVGDLYMYNGGIYEVTAAHTSVSTPTPQYVKLRSWLMGTGQSGATASDGNRDTLLGSDGIHYTNQGHSYLAARMATSVSRIITAYLAGTTFTVTN